LVDHLWFDNFFNSLLLFRHSVMDKVRFKLPKSLFSRLNILIKSSNIKYKMIGTDQFSL